MTSQPSSPTSPRPAQAQMAQADTKGISAAEETTPAAPIEVAPAPDVEVAPTSASEAEPAETHAAPAAVASDSDALPTAITTTATTATTSSSASSHTRPSASAPPAASLILGVAVVDFNHLQGPIVEWSYPSSLCDASIHPDLTSSLPFCALPDGSHLSDEDFAHFHLHCPTISRHATVFGISCNRQIASDKLLVRGKDVTRSTVQKAVVVLAKQPVFAPLREKLGIVTRAFFAQGDLADTDILVDFYETLEAGLRAAGLRAEDVKLDDDFDDNDSVDGDDDDDDDDESTADYAEKTATQADFPLDKLQGPPRQEETPSTAATPTPSIPPSRDEEAKQSELREGVMYMGTSLRELVYKFRFKTLMLVKLLLLQKRIMFFGYPVERLCVYEYTLVSLIPGLLLSLSDCSSPELAYAKRHPIHAAESVKTSDRASLLRFCGCPLRLFGENAFFQPYLPLQQIDMLKAETWLVGTTNLIFKQQREFKPDVVVDLEHSTLDFTPAQQQHNSNAADNRLSTQTPRASSEQAQSQPQSQPQTRFSQSFPSTSASASASASSTLQSIVSLTPADRKWMDELVHVVVESYNPADPSRPTTMRYEGSEDWIRAKFEDYICSFLACVKYSNSLGASADVAPSMGGGGGSSSSGAATPSVPGSLSSPSSTAGTYPPLHSYSLGGADSHSLPPEAHEAIASYGPAFLSAFKATRAHATWDRATSPLLFDLVPFKHPCAGKVSALEDVSLRLTAGLHDLRLEEQMASGREALGNAGRGLFQFANNVGMEVAKRRREWLAAQASGAAGATPGDGSSATATAPGSGDTISHASPSPLTSQPSSSTGAGATWGVDAQQISTSLAPHAQAAQQAAAQASTEVRAALGRFGSFLGSRTGWGAGAGAGAATGGSAASNANASAGGGTGGGSAGT